MEISSFAAEPMAPDDAKILLAPRKRHEDEEQFSEEYCEGDLTYVRDIASGGMSKVSLYIFHKDGNRRHVAVKTLFQKLVSERDTMHLRTEVNILTKLDHENIIRTYGIAQIGYNVGLVLEYFPNGCYTDFFREFWHTASKTKDIEENICPLKLRIIKEIISAMAYLHLPRKLPAFAKEQSTLHLDLKGENVLLDQQLHVKICDFGLSMMATLTRLRSGTTVHSRGVSGTPGFIAPERLKNGNCKPSTKCDVYSFGILQYTILTDLPPYPEHVVEDFRLLEYHVAEKKLRPDVSTVPEIFPDDLIIIMEECWSDRQDSRPSFQELNERVAALLEHISAFESQATDAVNRVIEMLTADRNRTISDHESANEELPDLLSFGNTSTDTRRPPDSMVTPLTAASSQMTAQMGRTSAVGVVSGIVSEDSGHADSRSFGLTYRQDLSTTIKKTPVACNLREDRSPTPSVSHGSQTGSTCNENNHDDGGDEEDHELLIPSNHSEIGVVAPSSTPYVYATPETNWPFRLSKKSLFRFGMCVIFAATIIIAFVIPLVNNSGSSKAKTCPPVQKPKHGTVLCEDETENAAAKCQFMCDDDFEIDGRDTIVCNGERWSEKEPSCEIACELPKISNGIVKCTNQTFEHSTCSISCVNHHVIQGKSVITCTGNGSWSVPVSSCECPKCSFGDNCEYSISWQGVVNNFKAFDGLGSVEVNYGGKVFSCSTKTKWDVLALRWTGQCVDKDTGTTAKCSAMYKNPANAAPSAASSLIRKLVGSKIYPEPCDMDNMPGPRSC